MTSSIRDYLGLRSPWLVYGATVLYVIYVFAAQWGSSAMRMNDTSLESFFSLLVNVTCLGGAALAFAKILIDIRHYNWRGFFFLLSIVSISLVAVTAKTPSLVLPLLIGFACLNVTNRSIAKIIVVGIPLLLLISSLFSYLGLNGGDKNTKPLLSEYDGTYDIATAMGLGNPNSVMLISFSAIVLALYLCKTRLQYSIVSTAALIVVFTLSIVTGSTTGIIMGILAVLLMTLFRYRSRVRQLTRRVAPHMFLIVTLVSIFVAVNFGTSGGTINNFLTGRPEFWNLRIENGSYMNIIGNNDRYETDYSPDHTGDYHALDNMPLFIIVRYGLVVYVIFLYIFYAGSKRIKEPELLVLVFLACIVMFSERMPLYGFVLLFLQKALVDYQYSKQKRIA